MPPVATRLSFLVNGQPVSADNLPGHTTFDSPATPERVYFPVSRVRAERPALP